MFSTFSIHNPSAITLTCGKNVVSYRKMPSGSGARELTFT